jgi:hypothetical protein
MEQQRLARWSERMGGLTIPDSLLLRADHVIE